MELTKYEQEIYTQILEWEYQHFNVIPSDFLNTYDEWLEETFSLLPDEMREKIFKQINQWVFYIHAAVMQTEQFDARVERIISEAKVINSDIETINDLKTLTLPQLNYIADKQISVHQIYSLLQGASAGSGSNLFLGLDIPAMLVINLRAVQLVGAAYGYDPKNPLEMMTALKVYHCSTLPRRFQKSAWEELISEIQEADNEFFYEGNEDVFDIHWVNQPLTQMIKAFVILLFRKNKHQNIPFLSMAIGAGWNYSNTKNITEFSKRFYQYRYFIEKGLG